MYVRTISRKNKDGSVTTYVQLAHNVRDPKSGFARAQVLHTFGRADRLDLEAIRRLVRSLGRFLSPEDENCKNYVAQANCVACVASTGFMGEITFNEYCGVLRSRLKRRFPEYIEFKKLETN